eukprot:664736_1
MTSCINYDASATKVPTTTSTQIIHSNDDEIEFIDSQIDDPYWLDAANVDIATGIISGLTYDVYALNEKVSKLDQENTTLQHRLKTANRQNKLLVLRLSKRENQICALIGGKRMNNKQKRDQRGFNGGCVLMRRQCWITLNLQRKCCLPTNKRSHWLKRKTHNRNDRNDRNGLFFYIIYC